MMCFSIVFVPFRFRHNKETSAEWFRLAVGSIDWTLRVPHQMAVRSYARPAAAPHLCVDNARDRIDSATSKWLQRVAGSIGCGPVSHAAGVRIRLVVSPQRFHPPPLWRRQVAAAIAEIAGGRQRSIVDIVGTDDAVVVGIDPPIQPPISG